MQGVQNMQTRGLQAPVDAAGNRLAGPPQPVQGTFFQPVSNAGPVSGLEIDSNYSGTLYDPNNPYSPFGEVGDHGQDEAIYVVGKRQHEQY